MSAIITAMPALCFFTGFLTLIVGTILFAIGVEMRCYQLSTVGAIIYFLGLFTMMASVVYPWR